MPSPTENRQYLDLSKLPVGDLVDKMTDAVGTWTDEWSLLGEEARNTIPVCYFRNQFDLMRHCVNILRDKKIAATEFLPPPPAIEVVTAQPVPISPIPTRESISMTVGKGKSRKTISILGRRPATT